MDQLDPARLEQNVDLKYFLFHLPKSPGQHCKFGKIFVYNYFIRHASDKAKLTKM